MTGRSFCFLCYMVNMTVVGGRIKTYVYLGGVFTVTSLRCGFLLWKMELITAPPTLYG